MDCPPQDSSLMPEYSLKLIATISCHMNYAGKSKFTSLTLSVAKEAFPYSTKSSTINLTSTKTNLYWPGRGILILPFQMLNGVNPFNIHIQPQNVQTFGNRIAKFISSTSLLCWKNCSQVGNIFHILWSCSKLDKFWTMIFTIFHQVTGLATGLAIQPSPSLALLIIGIEDILPPPRHYTTLFIVAKLVILRI